MSLTRFEARLTPLFYIFLCLFFCFSSVFASKKEDMALYQTKLERVQKSIAKVQNHLKGNKKQRSHVVTELKNLESEISKNAKKLKQLEHDVNSIKSQKSTLESELKQFNIQLKTQRNILSEQIRSAYILGPQQNLKLLLNQQDPAQIGRTKEYFNYLNRARQDQIDIFLETIQQKQQTEARLAETLVTQGKLLDEQKARKRERQNQRLKRKKLVAELSDKIKNQEKHFKQPGSKPWQNRKFAEVSR